MRSRTEMVTTTFIDSEDDKTETEDSEEDWRPDLARSGKRRTASKRQNKRKANSSGYAGREKVMKPNFDDFKEASNSEDEDYGNVYTNQTANEQKSPSDKIVPVKTGSFNLYLYKKDLGTNYKENSHLCLWRRDGTNLLQKYIRVKTTNVEEFMFTSSSVFQYSSWDEKRRKEFASIHVKCLEENNRRVTIVNPVELITLADQEVSRKLISTSAEGNSNESSNNKVESQEEDDYESYADPSDEENEAVVGDDEVQDAQTENEESQ